MDGNKSIINVYLKDYILLGNDGLYYISEENAKKLIFDLPHTFENIVAYTDIEETAGLKYFSVKTIKGRKDLFTAYIQNSQSPTEEESIVIEKEQSKLVESTTHNYKKAIPEYPFLKKTYKDIHSLIIALTSHWEDGKKQLCRGLLSSFFKNFNPEIAGYCIDAEEAIREDSANDDIIFLRLLFQLSPDLKSFHWKGHNYDSISDLGLEMLNSLWKNDTTNYNYWDSILKNKVLTLYLTYSEESKDDIITLASKIENIHSLTYWNEHDALMNYYIIAYILSGKKVLSLGEKQFQSVQELTAYLKVLYVSSRDEFEDFCHYMINNDETLNVQFEAWLTSLGKGKGIDIWKKNTSSEKTIVK